jgi:hypothetical protein
MAEEGADALVELRRNDVFEAASLLMGLGVFDGKCVGKKSLGKTMATNHVASPPRTRFRKTNLPAIVEGTQLPVAAAVA